MVGNCLFDKDLRSHGVCNSTVVKSSHRRRDGVPHIFQPAPPLHYKQEFRPHVPTHTFPMFFISLFLLFRSFLLAPTALLLSVLLLFHLLLLILPSLLSSNSSSAHLTFLFPSFLLIYYSFLSFYCLSCSSFLFVFLPLILVHLLLLLLFLPLFLLSSSFPSLIHPNLPLPRSFLPS